MTERIKDITDERIGKLVAVKFDKRIGKASYWIFKCDCGKEISRIPSSIRLNKYKCCPTCFTGEGTHGWKGHGKIPHAYFTTIKHSAVSKKLEFSITIEYLWNLYLKQEGKCSFTGWDINFYDIYINKKSKTASLDRINSSKGYIEGNLQWVHRDVNKLKKNLSDELFIKICLAVANKQNHE